MPFSQDAMANIIQGSLHSNSLVWFCCSSLFIYILCLCGPGNQTQGLSYTWQVSVQPLRLHPSTSLSFNLKRFYFRRFIFSCAVWEKVCACKCRCLQSPEGHARSPGSPYVDAGNGTQVLYKQRVLLTTEPSLQHHFFFF